MKKRDDFSASVKDKLAKRVGFRCSNPNCRKPTSGPHEESGKSVSIGVAAHITAASSDGPRYNLNLTTLERKAIGNGIWLCQNCAKLIDSDESRFSVKSLIEWKNLAEEKSRDEIEEKFVDQCKNIRSPNHSPIPTDIYGLPYSEAREILIRAGWQPFMNYWSFAEDPSIQYGNGPIFWDKGYWEIENASGTGLAHCRFGFRDVYRNHLKVVTHGEEYAELNIHAVVDNYFIEKPESLD